MIFSTLIIILNLFLLESLLSIDNAAVLAILVNHLPEADRPKALKYGILGAFGMRGISLFLAAWIIKIIWLKIIGGMYLLYLSYQFFDKLGLPQEEKSSKPFRWLTGKIGLFWSTVILVEIMDMSFSIDNIFAAVALCNNIWLIIIGVFMGIVAMRFVAQWFMSLIRHYPSLEKSAFIVITILGIKIVLSGIIDYIPDMHEFSEMMSGHWFQTIFSLITLAVFLYPIFKEPKYEKKN
jgi:YkoY family integral membrane protein